MLHLLNNCNWKINLMSCTISLPQYLVKFFFYYRILNCGLENLQNPFVIVFVTVSSKEEAEKISQQLLEEKLVACANILGPITSHFYWLGKIDCVEEFLVLLKSRMDLFNALSEKIKSLYSYEVPEILALPVVAGSRDYLNWFGESLKKSS